MDITELTLKLLFLLIPGALASLIFEKLTIHKPWDSFKFISHSFLFGVLAYVLTDEIIAAVNYTFHTQWPALKIFTNLESKGIPLNDIGRATVCGISIGLICSAADHYRLINRFAAAIRFSAKFGDINLYTHFLNSPDVQAVYFRDLKSNLTYHGLVESFSENDDIKEIVLRNVVVYYNEGKVNGPIELYRLNSVYLSRPTNEVLIEVPVIEPQKKEADERQKNRTTRSAAGRPNQGSDETSE
jgi:hypothetical protein